MAGWEGLRADLRRLLEESPDALVVFPDPNSERYERRIRIDLAAWATDIAATLNAKYGSLVDLRVGAMTFPARQLWVGERWYQIHGTPAEPAGLDVDPLSPLSVRTGRSTHEDVLVTNRTAHEQVLLTNGALTSAVTESSGSVVGLYVGPHTAALVGFPIEPHQSRPVPVLIGTASMVPDLGYAVRQDNGGWSSRYRPTAAACCRRRWRSPSRRKQHNKRQPAPHRDTRHPRRPCPSPG